MASPSAPDSRAFDFDPSIVATSRPALLAGEALPEIGAFAWRDLAGLITAVAAVPAVAMVLMFAAVATYGPPYLDGHPVRIAVAPADVDTTGSVAWRLRDTFDD